MFGFLKRLFGFGRKAEAFGSIGRKSNPANFDLFSRHEFPRGKTYTEAGFAGITPQGAKFYGNPEMIVGGMPKSFDAGRGRFYGNTEGMLMDFKYPSN